MRSYPLRQLIRPKRFTGVWDYRQTVAIDAGSSRGYLTCASSATLDTPSWHPLETPAQSSESFGHPRKVCVDTRCASLGLDRCEP